MWVELMAYICSKCEYIREQVWYIPGLTKKLQYIAINGLSRHTPSRFWIDHQVHSV